MYLLPHILAETEIDLPKIIFGLIFFIIWALSAFVSWLNKKQQEAKRRAAQARDRMLAQGSAVLHRERPAPPRIAEGIAQRFPDVLLPPAPPPIPQQRRPVPPAPPPVRRAPKPQQRRAVIPIPPTLPMAPVLATQPYVNITQPPPRRKASTVDAVAMRKWLTPATLRHQFILTEILQPPLALRPHRTDHA